MNKTQPTSNFLFVAGGGWTGFLVCIAAILILKVSPVQAFDFSDWDGLVKKYVSPITIDGVNLSGISYEKIKVDPAYVKLVQRLKSASLEELKTPKEKLTFWVNVYNIFAVKTVVDNYPVDSIKDVGSIFKSVWKRKAGVVAGKERTLNEIEHKILRKMGDPRIHTAIVCASVSCPDLRSEAYVSERIDEQLDDQMKTFLQNSGKGMRVERGNKKVYISSIFKWFKEDFESMGGVISFISRYISPSDKKLLNQPKIKIAYLDYNWDLNSVKSGS